MNNNDISPENCFVSTTFYKDGSSLNEALKHCENNNIFSLEIGSNHIYERSYEYIKKYDFNFLVHNYFPVPEESFVVNIASLDSKIRNRSIDHIKRSIDFSKSINAKLYTFHPGFINDPLGSNLIGDNYDFRWDEGRHDYNDIFEARDLMYDALDKIIEFNSDDSFKIAIETEGSVSKKNYLLMQKPDEYIDFMQRYDKNRIGINLNLGHVLLASNSFNFSINSFVNLISDYVFAMELSHNNGIEDEHLPLRKNGWYWSIILNEKFKNLYKIFEFRNSNIEDIIENFRYYRENESEF